MAFNLFGSQQPGFVPTAFDPDDPMAQQMAMAQAIRGGGGQQPQEQAPDMGTQLLQGIAGGGDMADPLAALFPALGFAQGMPQAALLRALLGAGGKQGGGTSQGGGLMGLGGGMGGLGGILGGGG